MHKFARKGMTDSDVEKADQLRRLCLPLAESCLAAMEEVCIKLARTTDKARSEVKKAGERAVLAINTLVIQKLQEVDDEEQQRLKDLHAQQDSLTAHVH